MKYILDADWIIEALAGKIHATDVLKDINPKNIFLCWFTIGEIYEGAYGSSNSTKRIESFRRFYRPFTILNLNEAIMENFAKIRFELRKKGTIISDFDILLAATAIHYDLTILTFNRKHFLRIPKLKLYN